MICLTGDIHHSSLKTGNQQHCDISEIQVAQYYNAMLEEAGVKVTYFVTGKSFADEWGDLKSICASSNMELGGHTYYCFEPELWHRIWNKLLQSYNGPRWHQKWDVQKTIDIIEDKTGKRISCWRNHMYMHGQFTDSVLKSCGITVCSDGVSKISNGLQESTEQGLFNLPLNIMPDHEHLIHAERTPQWIEQWQKRYNWSDDFGSKSYYIEEWTERVLEQLHYNEENNIISNMIIHPITLYLCDKLKSYQKILEFLASCKTVHMSEIYNQHTAKGAIND